MRRWMGSHFHNWIDYSGVAHFGIFWGKNVFRIYGLQAYENVCIVGVKCSSFNLKNGSIQKIKSD